TVPSSGAQRSNSPACSTSSSRGLSASKPCSSIHRRSASSSIAFASSESSTESVMSARRARDSRGTQRRDRVGERQRLAGVKLVQRLLDRGVQPSTLRLAELVLVVDAGEQCMRDLDALALLEH